ncbi:selenocysteine-specific elongation factor [Keratinibaculum paraultunense]|uniref:Selenocysteine-specific elongation factor n=1 Tax=Keratinibaculum paraultunense TaxID=1278232 RepID=A0A4R3KZQ5_9FIRM|nr:selenocysteine-specific translation elongation factor [Keratinibaculum paraultunense]QQY80444.1 selenocysteine-specific translation elongation factor [Keratinibaculum paraultunense]TCS91162.1 selenocysteine-specific elongation factor [Keratinibaculum paraultunense]
MKHVIIGTAGHIDHGKTTLIRALTGRNTDRLKEEQKRGISIDLGFTYFDLPSGKRAGIIDVPGHEKFIKNMLAGVVGIDIVLLVVAADEGVMPQTSEHLAILDLIGVEKGFVVITKSDLVEEEWLELVKDDIKDELKDTFLEGAPIIPVSSTKGIGLEDVKTLIDKLALELEDREVNDMPRLPVDRVFSIPGFGTIVTGTLLSGKFHIGEEIQVFPGNRIGRIRSMQVHDEDTDVAYAGQRVAINIAGLKKEQISRGDVVAPINSMKETSLLDVKVKLIEGIDRSIENRTRLRLYIGAREVLCRIVLLDRDILNPGEETYAQLILEEEIVAKRGDRFILRFYSPMFTVGGGQVLEPNPTKKKRFDEKALEELRIKEKGEPIDVIEKIILDKSSSFPTLKEISIYTAMLENKIKEEIEKLIQENKIIQFSLTKDLHFIHIQYFNQLKDNIIEELRKFHKKHPLRIGMPKEEIRSKFLKNAKPKIGDRFIDLLIEKGYIEQHKENICIKGFKIEYSPSQLKIKEEIIENYVMNKFLPPKREELYEKIQGEKEEIEQVLNSLINEGEIVKLNEEILVHKFAYAEALKILKKHIEKNGSITVAEYRDELNTNRKVALSLLEYFDQIKITKREGNRRFFF